MYTYTYIHSWIYIPETVPLVVAFTPCSLHVSRTADLSSFSVAGPAMYIYIYTYIYIYKYKYIVDDDFDSDYDDNNIMIQVYW
jgi:hypothetical protein